MVVIAIALYVVNALGLHVSTRQAAAVAAVAALPLVVMLGGLVLRTDLLDAARLRPMAVPGHGWAEAGTWLLIVNGRSWRPGPLTAPSRGG